MSDWVKIERRFDAPIQTVWEMWADPAQFQNWYGPMGFSVPVAEMDVTVGGTRKICMEMKGPDRTMTMWFIGEYKDVSAPNRLVYTESMCDADGNVMSPASMGMPEGTPDTTEVSVELVEEGGQTVMTMTHAGVPAGTPARVVGTKPWTNWRVYWTPHERLHRDLHPTLRWGVDDEEALSKD